MVKQFLCLSVKPLHRLTNSMNRPYFHEEGGINSQSRNKHATVKTPPRTKFTLLEALQNGQK